MVALAESPHSFPDRHPLTISTEGKVAEWFQALHTKRVWTERDDPRADTIHLELDLAGGGMQGVMHVGLLLALKQRGLLEYIDRVVGVSTGALAAVVAFGMKDEKAVDAYSHVAMHGFVSARRIAVRDAIDLPGVYNLLSRLIEKENIQNAHTQLSSIVTDVDTGEAREIDATRHKDPLRVAVASAAVPGMTKSPYELPLEDGKVIHTVDGIVSSPYPKSVLHARKITHRLVASPYPPGGDTPWFHRGVMMTDLRLLRYPNCRRAIWNLNAASERDLAAIHSAIDEGENVGLIYPDQAINPFSQDWLSYLGPYQRRATEKYGEKIDQALLECKKIIT